MSRIASARFALLTAGLLAAAPAALHAQKALVYCPVGIDASGCNAIVTALNASPTPFPGGVDGGYDGTQSTVDLATADLSGYAVFVVPSLADGAGTQPYGLLRDATITARLRAAFMGRVAVWSGTPDVGSTNRSAKDGLIRNLANWAKPDSAGTHGPGMVVLQDNSDDAAGRYGWLGGISQMSVTADSTLDVYSNVQVLTTTGQTILTNSSGLQIGYTNMASYGLVRGAGVAATDDATGGRSTRAVLVTMQGEPSDPNMATVSTDREDYFPPDTVIISGAGWEPGETVNLLIKEDLNPPIEPDITLTTVADGAGHIFNQQFQIDSADIGVRFTLTATGQTSGRTAQATFTDAPGVNLAITKSHSGNFTVGASGGSYSIVVSNSSNTNSSGAITVKDTLPATLTFVSAAGTNWSCSASAQIVTCTTTQVIIAKTMGVDGTSSTITLTVTPTSAGSITNRATVSGGGEPAGNVGSENTSSDPTTIKQNQTISFTSAAPGSAVVGGATYGAAATATSSLTVTFSSLTPSVCTSSGTNGATITMVGVGSCTVAADQAGNATFNPAPQKTQTFAVGKGSQTIAFTSSAPGAAVVGGATYTATATGGASGNPVVFSSLTTGVCTSSGANGATISFIAVGTCTVAANQAGNTNYNPAAQVTQTFSVGQGSQTITFTSTAPTTATFGGPVYTVTATGGASGNAVTFSSLTTGVCASSGTNGATISFIAAGTCTVAADQAGNTNYNAASQATQTFTVGQANQTITFDLSTLPAKTFGDPDFSVAIYVTGFGASGNPVTFSSGSPTRCTVSSAGLVHIITAGGNCTVTASQAGNANYNAAPDVNQSFNVAKAAQTITFTSTAPVGAFVGGPTYLASATSTSGLTVTLGTSTPLVCTSSGANGATITMVGGGTCIVTANQPGNGNYLTATQVTQTFIVTAQQAQTISFSSTAPNNAVVGGATYTAAATASSALTVSFSSLTTSVCTSSGTNGATFTFLAVGTCTVAANQPGNASFLAAPQVTQGFAVGKGAQTITFAALGNKTYGEADFGVSATASSGLAVTFAASGQCTVTVATVHITGFGSCTITASQTGNANYNAATNVQQSFTIGKAALAPHITADNKVYNGNADATILTRTLSGVFPGDVVSLTGGTASFADKHVGTGKAVTGSVFTLAGGDAGNYELSPSPGATTANITVRTLTVTATGIPKVYDHTTAATVTLADDRVGGDLFALSYTANFNTKDVGTGKPVSVTAIAIGAGVDAGDYVLGNSTTSTTANITRRPITVTATGINKLFDGNTSATVTLSATPLAGDVIAPLTYASAAFATPTAGVNKPVSVTGIALNGVDKDNYLANTTAATTANITYTTLYGHKFLQPVNLYPDPKSAFKINSTIPVKFQLFQADGVTPVSGAVATISTLKLSSSAPDGVNEDVVSTVADQGVTFRYDAAGKQYIFNLGTKSWTQGGYRLIATLDDGSTITADIEARTK